MNRIIIAILFSLSICGLARAAGSPVCIIINGTCVSSGNPLPTTSDGGNQAVNIAQWAGQILGAITNYGTSPGAVLVPGVNAFVTNVVTFTAASLPLPTNAAQETGGNLSTLAGAIISSVMQSNLKQVNGITALTGAGAVGTGAQRVSVGQDATTIAGSSPGTAGSASANVVTVQGIASMTPIFANITQWASGSLGAMANYGTSPGAVLVPSVNAFVTNTTAVSSALASFVDGSIVTIGTEADAAWVSGSGTLIAISKSSAASLATLAGTISAGIIQSNLKQVNGVTTLAGAGAVGTGSQRVAVGQDPTTIAGSSPGTAGSASSNVLTVQGIASMTPIFSNITQWASGSLGAMANYGTSPGAVLVPGVNASVTNTPTVYTGSISHVQCSALCANLVVDGAPGGLFSFDIAADSTLSAAAWWIMIYDATSAPMDGSVTPIKCYALPLGTTSYAGAFPNPIQFATGITIGVSTNGCFTKAASTHAFIGGDFK